MCRPLAFRLWAIFALIALVAMVTALFLDRPLIAFLAFLSPGPWIIWQALVARSRGLGPAITRFATTERQVWLTIDDGPDPATTPRLLDLLDAHRARVTFFVIGEKAARFPELLTEIVRRGHTVGNHTHTHPHATFWSASAKTTANEIARCDAAIHAAGIPPTPWFRPPVGLKSLALHPELAKRQKQLVLWNARGFDTRVRTSEEAVTRILRTLSPGAIILLHESGPPDAPRFGVVQSLLEHLTRERYACVIPSSESLSHT